MVYFAGGWRPPAPLLLNPGGAGFFCRVSAFLPPSPRPPSPAGKGEIFGFLMQGAPPLASLGAKPGRHWLGRGWRPGTPAAKPARRWLAGRLRPGTPAAKPARHWLFSAMSVLFYPHPPDPPSRREGGDFCFILPGAGAPGTPATKPARHWLFSAMSVLFYPHPPCPLPGGKGETKVILCKGLRPLHPRG